MKPTQYFSDDYLKRCSNLSAEEVARFLDDFRQIHSASKKAQTKLISLKVELPLLNAFKEQARLDGVPYQTRIKQLMRDWLQSNDNKR